jgi:hypothetical protein
VTTDFPEGCGESSLAVGIQEIRYALTEERVVAIEERAGKALVVMKKVDGM